MAKEWVLNQAMNRWGLNKQRSVGSCSDLIRRCAPRKIREWRAYYFKNVYPESHLEDLGRKLYIKISEVIHSEVKDVTEEECIAYMKDVVIRRTFDGYQGEIQTIYGQTEKALGVKVHPAPDDWDRRYNVDFYIQVGDKYIGLQIKPVTFEHTFEQHKWKEMQKASHEKFQKKYGGRVFTIFSIKSADKKTIKNPEILDEIKKEIQLLEREQGIPHASKK